MRGWLEIRFQRARSAQLLLNCFNPCRSVEALEAWDIRSNGLAFRWQPAQTVDFLSIHLALLDERKLLCRSQGVRTFDLRALKPCAWLLPSQLAPAEFAGFEEIVSVSCSFDRIVALAFGSDDARSPRDRESSPRRRRGSEVLDREFDSDEGMRARAYAQPRRTVALTFDCL